MKSIVIVFVFLSFSSTISAQSGFCFSSSTRGSFEDVKATKFEKIKTKTAQTNIYTFSFNDSLLIHHIVLETGTVCQLYKITSIEEINSTSYFIQVVSGSSGSEYFYFLNSNPDAFSFYQIDTIGENDRMSGSKFGEFGDIDLITFEQ